MFKLVVVMTSMEPFHFFQKAQMELEKRFPGAFKLDLFSTTELDDEPEAFECCQECVASADFVFVKIHGSLSFFKQFLPFFDFCRNKKKIYLHTTIEEENKETFPECGLLREDFKRIYRYYKSGGYNNILNLVLWLANQFASGAYDVEEPVYAVWSGLYDPDQEIEDEMYYLERVRQSDLPVVGILTSSNLAHNNRDVPQLDALFRSLKNQGAGNLSILRSPLRSRYW